MAKSLIQSFTFYKAILFTVCLFALISLFWTPYNPELTNLSETAQLPSINHILGTDLIGRDIFSVFLAGCKVVVLLIVSTSILTAVYGLILAVLSNRFIILATVVDVFISIPTILIAMILAAALGSSLLVIILSCSLGYGVVLSRILASEIRILERSEFFEASLSLGQSYLKAFILHIIPNLKKVLFTQMSICSASVILAEAGLTYLGYGAKITMPSWGQILNSLIPLMSINPILCLAPGLFISLTIFSLYKLK